MIGFDGLSTIKIYFCIYKLKGNILIYTKNNYKVNEFVKNNESLKGHEGKDSRNEIKQFLIITFALPYFGQMNPRGMRMDLMRP